LEAPASAFDSKWCSSESDIARSSDQKPLQNPLARGGRGGVGGGGGGDGEGGGGNLKKKKKKNKNQKKKHKKKPKKKKKCNFF
jgi:hypothetical protein